MSCQVEPEIIHISAGSTGVFPCTYTTDDEDKTPISLVGYEIYVDFVDKRGEILKSCSIGDGITIVEESNININIGKFIINAGSTFGWPIGEMPVDILYVKEGLVDIITNPFILKFRKGITKKPNA